MKQKGILLLWVCCFAIITMAAQEISPRYQEEGFVLNQKKSNYMVLGVEVGFDFMTGSFNSDKWPIRQDVSYYDSYSGSYIHTEGEAFYVGIKPEFIFQDGKYSIATGLRYRSMGADLSNSSYRSNYFYLRYDDNSTNTKYARVKSITEDYDLLGIPLELKWAPIRFSGVSFYLKAGCDFYFKVNSKVEVDFVNESMKNEQEKILDYIDAETNNFYSRAYGGLGMSYTAQNRMGISFDILFPVNLTENNFALMKPDTHTSIQLLFQIPLSK